MVVATAVVIESAGTGRNIVGHMVLVHMRAEIVKIKRVAIRTMLHLAIKWAEARGSVTDISKGIWLI